MGEHGGATDWVDCARGTAERAGCGGSVFEMSRRLFLFGAGASHGSGPVTPEPTPLTWNLYAALKAKYPRWARMFPYCASSFENDFEEGMAKLYGLGIGADPRSHAVAPYLCDMARYFATFRPGTGNAYSRLASALGAAGKLDGTVFSTLNYDCLLEQCLQALGKQVVYFEDRASAGVSATCWKIHGSCNFIPEQEIKMVGIAMGFDHLFGSKLKATGLDDVDRYCTSQDDAPSAFHSPFVPTMVAVMPGKPVPFANPTISDLQRIWTRSVGAVDVVALVGVRPNPNDDHIWGPIASTAAKVVAVGGPDGYREFDTWRNAYRGGRPFEYLGDGFDQTVDALVRSV